MDARSVSAAGALSFIYFYDSVKSQHGSDRISELRMRTAR